MSFINNLPRFAPNNEQEISLADIAKCKGSGSFVGRIIGQIETLWRTGHFVTDKAVANFMIAHKDHLYLITNEFKNLSLPADSQRFTKQLKEDQGVARRLSKVFAQVAHANHLKDFETDMTITQKILKGLKVLDQCEAIDLLRAVAFERELGVKPSSDLKQHFWDFIQDQDIQNEEDLKTAYQEFKSDIRTRAYANDKEAFAKLSSYPSDMSTLAYLVSGHEDVGLYPDEYAKVQAMSVQDLLKSQMSQTQAQDAKIIEKGLLAMSAMDPLELLKAAVYDKNKGEEAKEDLKSHFSSYISLREIKNEESLRDSYNEFKLEMVEAAKKGDLSAIEKLKRYPEDHSLEKFNSLSEKIRSEFINMAETDLSRFEEIDLGDSSSLLSEVKGMGVEALVANLKWGSS